MMLHLKVVNESAFLVPCYDMDLAWHTHQLHPRVYERDTTTILGKVSQYVHSHQLLWDIY